MTAVSIVCPTVKGREASLERTRAAYALTTDREYEFIVEAGHATCGAAWNAGVARATGELVHLTADDIVPHMGWLDAGAARLHTGAIPAARILHGDGTLQSCGDQYDREEGHVTEVARIPLLPADLARAIFPIPPIHYYTDNIVSDRARDRDWPTVVTRGYLFTHHLAGEGRLDRLAQDGQAYFAGRR